MESPAPSISDVPGAGNVAAEAIPQPFRAQVELLKRRYGLNEVTASLTALSAVLGACGGSRRILNPADLTALAPSLSIVIAGSSLHLGSALNLVVDPVRQWILQRIGKPDRRGDNQRRLEIAALYEQLVHVDVTVAQARQPPAPGMERLMYDEGQQAHRLREIEAERDAILENIEDRAFRLAPFLLADDPTPAALLDPGKLCLDGAVLHVSTAGRDWISALRRAPSAMKADLASLLARSWRGLPDSGSDHHVCPFLSSIIIVDQGADDLWGRELTRYGLPDQYFHVTDASDASFDLHAGCEDVDGDLWTGALQVMVNTRLRGDITYYHLSPDAVALYEVQLNALIRAAPVEGKIAERWALLSLKTTLLIHLASTAREEVEIGAETLAAGSELALKVCEATSQFIRQRRASAPSAEKSGGVERLVATLKRRGPLRWRQLLQSSHSQKAKPLRTRLNQALKEGRVRKEGELYVAVADQ